MSYEPPKSRARLWLSVVLLAVCTVIVLMITMSPIPVDRGYQGAVREVLDIAHRHGVPGWYGYFALEFSSNIVMFLPLGFLIALALPRRWWWLVFLIAPAFSIAIELSQGAFLPQRIEDVTDIMANTVGGWLGGLMSAALRAVVGARDKTVLRRAIWEYEQARGIESFRQFP